MKPLRTAAILFAVAAQLTLQGCSTLSSLSSASAAQQTVSTPAAASSSGSSGSSSSGPTTTSLPPGLSISPSSTTIVATFHGTVAGTSTLSCAKSSDSPYISAVDNGINSSLLRQNIVAGLQPSTIYYCVMTLTDASGSVSMPFTQSTTATKPSTPITGITLGDISTYNSINPANQMWGDTFYNCQSSDGSTYLTTDDTGGWQQNGYPAANWTALQLVKFTSLEPLAGITINPFNAYGPSGTATGDDRRSQKDAGLFCMAGNLYMTIGRQLNQATGGMGTNTAYTQNAGQVIWSADHGQTWNNFEDPNSFNAASPTSPQSSTMFPGVPGNMGSATFVMYCADDGTLGYLTACNRTDNADAYVYLMANDGYWDSGNALYLARVPRAKINRLQPSDYEFYTGSGDGSLTASWTTNQSSAAPVISNPGKLGEPNVQYIPSLNRYLLLTYSYPQGLNPGARHSEHSQWLAYEAPHPWGPWTVVASADWQTQGYYNPVILNSTITTGDTPTIMFTGDFFGNGTYQMYLSKLTLQH